MLFFGNHENEIGIHESKQFKLFMYPFAWYVFLLSASYASEPRDTRPCSFILQFSNKGAASIWPQANLFSRLNFFF